MHYVLLQNLKELASLVDIQRMVADRNFCNNESKEECIYLRERN